VPQGRWLSERDHPEFDPPTEDLHVAGDCSRQMSGAPDVATGPAGTLVAWFDVGFLSTGTVLAWIAR
jgi:hypothetical protein